MGVWKELLFPRRCLFCRQVLRPDTGQVCRDCENRLTAVDGSRTGQNFSVCWTAMSYEGTVRDAILRFKFQDQPDYAGPLGQILGSCIERRLVGRFDRITWVPVSPRRRRQRGYDQAELLARSAADRLHAEAVSTLVKNRDNPAQSSLEDAALRQQNVRGAYQVTDPALVRGARLLLIDDIITTGSTLDEAAGILRAAGAADVVAAALAQPV